MNQTNELTDMKVINSTHGILLKKSLTIDSSYSLDTTENNVLIPWDTELITTVTVRFELPQVVDGTNDKQV